MATPIRNTPAAAATSPSPRETVRTGSGAAALAEAVLDHLHYTQARLPQHASANDWYVALACAVRDRMLDRYITTVDAITSTDATSKVVAYLSAEFLTGPHLGNGLVNLGLSE